MQIAAVLLAAGGSRRMGRAKQLLEYQGEALVRRAARTIIEAGFSMLHVVVGDQSAGVIRAIQDLDVTICENPHWEKGIGTSIRAGVRSIRAAHPLADGILIALTDQPGIAVSHFTALRSRFESHHCAVGSSYNDATGVPAIFSRAYFEELMALPDDQGAKLLLSRPGIHVETIPLTDAQDIDLPADYDRLLGR
ncbi:MAG: nucleotidyltransferase family protein [Burkholderiales bacterium]|nr:nucleotidyltransferase family protein [Phycisphaerae bacterium]